MSTFTNATLMITGGTGSFGSTVLKHFLDSDLKEIRIFSRDEKKQDDMRHELQARHPEHAKKVKFYIGDVRNPQSVRDAMPGVDYIFHAAALKQVPSCEFFPMEAVRTNVIGTDNVLHAAIDAGVKRVVCLSTDKAAYIYRFWTGASFRLVSTCYQYNRIIVLHVPAEKEKGMKKLYERYIQKGIVPADRIVWKTLRLLNQPFTDRMFLTIKHILRK